MEPDHEHANSPTGLVRWVRWGFVSIYAVLVALAVGYYEFYVHYDPGNSELSGLPIIVLGLPWSVGIPQLIGAGGGSQVIGWISIVGGIIINGIILRLVGQFVARLLLTRSQ
jgi:hypothetical protein